LWEQQAYKETDRGRGRQRKSKTDEGREGGVYNLRKIIYPKWTKVCDQIPLLVLKRKT